MTDNVTLTSTIWQYITGNIAQIIIWVVGLIVVGVIVAFITQWLKTSKRKSQEEKTEQAKKLRMHFEDLKLEADYIEQTLWQLNAYYGAILWNVRVDDPIDIVQAPTKPSVNFVSHFPSVASELQEYAARIESHNKAYKSFCQKVTDVFERRKISVLKFYSDAPPTHISRQFIFPALFNWWHEKDQGKADPQPDFARIRTYPDSGPNNLYASGWNAASIAYGESDADKEALRNAISEVALNKDLQTDAAGLVRSAGYLVEETKKFGERLRDQLIDVVKYWPGTKPYKFKKELKKCSKCQEIFG